MSILILDAATIVFQALGWVYALSVAISLGLRAKRLQDELNLRKDWAPRLTKEETQSIVERAWNQELPEGPVTP